MLVAGRWQAESEVKGAAKDGASKTSEDVLAVWHVWMRQCPLSLKLL